MADENGFLNFLNGLLMSMRTGMQSSVDAFDQDVDAVKQGKFPPQAMKTGGQILSQMASPSVNPVIPALQYTRRVYDPVKDAYDVSSKIYPGGDWLTMAMRSGNFGPFMQALVKAVENKSGN